MGAMKRILVGMSGGVDSAVAALLLKQQGYAVCGAFMKTWMHEDDSEIFADCPWEEDMEDARRCAEHLDIEFQVVNLIRDYRERVVDYLVEGYRRGITPNPDLMCNREMKFGVFLEYARAEGFDAVATGHYARKEVLANGLHVIREGQDKNKDQSYFLALVQQQQLRQALFPLGEISKPEVRVLAQKYALPVAAKKDSQGICFLGKININDFLRQFIPDTPGEIVTPDGRVRGEHRGLHHFTLGQRKGLGVPSNTDNEHFVVVSKEFAKNRLVIDFDHRETPGLYQREMRLRDLSWLTGEPPEQSALLGKPRYRDPSVPLELIWESGGTARVCFSEPQRALARGQLLALYEGDRLLGGGFYA